MQETSISFCRFEAIQLQRGLYASSTNHRQRRKTAPLLSCMKWSFRQSSGHRGAEYGKSWVTCNLANKTSAASSLNRKKYEKDKEGSGGYSPLECPEDVHSSWKGLERNWAATRRSRKISEAEFLFMRTRNRVGLATKGRIQTVQYAHK